MNFLVLIPAMEDSSIDPAKISKNTGIQAISIQASISIGTDKAWLQRPLHTCAYHIGEPPPSLHFHSFIVTGITLSWMKRPHQHTWSQNLQNFQEADQVMKKPEALTLLHRLLNASPQPWLQLISSKNHRKKKKGTPAGDGASQDKEAYTVLVTSMPGTPTGV